MEIEIELSKLRPYENNPRNNDNAVAAVAESISQCGYIAPIVVDENMEVLAGHTRLRALKKLNYKTAAVRVIEGLTEDQKKKYRLLDNKTAELAEWDMAKLAEELEGLDFGDFDFGFDLAADDPDTDPEIDEEIPEEEITADPRAKLGQIYKLGDHRLMCGDSTKSEDVSRLLGSDQIDMIFTDPPYGMDLDTDFSDMRSKLGGSKDLRGNKYEQGHVDEFHPEMVSAALQIKAREIFLWEADYFAELLPDKNKGSWIVWDKRAYEGGDIEDDYSSDKMFGSCFELCWSKVKHKREIARVKWAGLFGMDQEIDNKRFHPTQKPVKLAEWFIDKYSKQGETILDLFGGSGCTLLACEDTGRKCLTMEYDPHYVDVIIARWEKMTGKKAELLEE